MNLIAGLQFLTFLVGFGLINYLLMLRRYENDALKNKKVQIQKISQLYPKGTFIST